METLLAIFGALATWFCGACAVGTFLMWWFTTSFPQHVFNALRLLGYRRKDKGFWVWGDSTIGYEGEVGDLTRGDWNRWLQEKFAVDHPKLAHLAQCPGCMSGQASLWLGLAAGLALWQPLWPLVALASWPVCGRILARCAAGV